MATKLYIAGKITGDPDYKAKFAAAAEEYKKNGYIVLCPSWMPQGMQPADYMRICFAMIDTADVVAFLPGFSKSWGAQLELQYCFYVDKDVRLPPNEFGSSEPPLAIAAHYELKDLREYYKRISSLPNCNDCGRACECKDVVAPGQTVRINCPNWAPKEAKK